MYVAPKEFHHRTLDELEQQKRFAIKYLSSTNTLLRTLRSKVLGGKVNNNKISTGIFDFL